MQTQKRRRMNVKFRKSDVAILREAETNGLVGWMTSLVERNRTELTNELSVYFRQEAVNYKSTYDEDDGEEIMKGINSYLETQKIEQSKLEYPYNFFSEIYLIPIGENIQLKVLVANEFSSDEGQMLYVDISNFIINEQATKKDVDLLLSFVKNHLH
jgi:hypothetical protein